MFFHDLRGDPSPRDRLNAILTRWWRTPQDPSEIPQVRLFHFQLGDESHCLALRWPHYLMDGVGAIIFLRSVAEYTDPTDDPCACDEAATVADAYPQAWSRRRFRPWVKGLGMWLRQRGVATARIRPAASIDDDKADFIYRNWSASDMAAVVAAARSACAPGPMRYTRHFIMAALRGLDDLRDALGLTGDPYVVPLPLLRPRTGPRIRATGNDLTIANLVIPRDLLHRPSECDAALSEQIAAYTREGRDQATWVNMAFAGWLRAGHYRRLMARGDFAPYSLGFASLRTDGLGGRFLTARINNLWMFGLPPIPLGVMVTFCMHETRLNLGVAFFPHVCRRSNAQRLAERIRHHVGVPSTRAVHAA